MKVYREISGNWDKNQVEILHHYNVDVKEGNDNFNIYDANTYLKLKSFLEKWNVLDTLGTEFTKKEILSVEYCVLARWKLFGYPMPDGDQGYLYNTYETKEMCDECGIGTVQKDDFRVKRVPKDPLWGVGWIFDEFFVHTDLYEKFFKPLGIACRPLRKYKDDSIIDSYVQLVIPVIEESLDLTLYNSKICKECGATKYTPKIRGYYPLHKHPLPYIYKSKEYFGSGFSANRKIFVSALVRDFMIESGMLKYYYFVPCAKSEDLDIKNQDLLKWI